ncbi:(d)CMP kinase [Paenibacillus thiaminolyticus]|uniref:(d)CMP kinase n=1 Tax=Paenibacillus TaxID=44249 RepID=UPI00105AA5D2|nr:(d)CMP kinase [Paenibacillus dendritiformis]TDL54108.1 (d)CMP kinase [Paenibacillus dendritiformis]
MTVQSNAPALRLNIAIDGPAGAGKSTVARLVARDLGYTYIDTGAMYRAVALHMLRLGIDPEDADAIHEAMKDVAIELIPLDSRQAVLLNGTDVTDEIRTPEISRLASSYARSSAVRERLVHLQRDMAARKGVVMDGRDIGTHVLPDAEQKWFVTASVEERARRRYAESSGVDGATVEQFMREIAARDKQDETRDVSPLRQAEDAVLLDTTRMSIDEVVRVIVDQAKLLCRDGER